MQEKILLFLNFYLFETIELSNKSVFICKKQLASLAASPILL